MPVFVCPEPGRRARVEIRSGFGGVIARRLPNDGEAERPWVVAGSEDRDEGRKALSVAKRTRWRNVLVGKGRMTRAGL